MKLGFWAYLTSLRGALALCSCGRTFGQIHQGRCLNSHCEATASFHSDLPSLSLCPMSMMGGGALAFWGIQPRTWIRDAWSLGSVRCICVVHHHLHIWGSQHEPLQWSSGLEEEPQTVPVYPAWWAPETVGCGGQRRLEMCGARSQSTGHPCNHQMCTTEAGFLILIDVRSKPKSSHFRMGITQWCCLCRNKHTFVLYIYFQMFLVLSIF